MQQLAEECAMKEAAWAAERLQLEPHVAELQAKLDQALLAQGKADARVSDIRLECTKLEVERERKQPPRCRARGVGGREGEPRDALQPAPEADQEAAGRDEAKTPVRAVLRPKL